MYNKYKTTLIGWHNPLVPWKHSSYGLVLPGDQLWKPHDVWWIISTHSSDSVYVSFTTCKELVKHFLSFTLLPNMMNSVLSGFNFNLTLFIQPWISIMVSSRSRYSFSFFISKVHLQGTCQEEYGHQQIQIDHSLPLQILLRHRVWNKMLRNSRLEGLIESDLLFRVTVINKNSTCAWSKIIMTVSS